VLAFAIPLVNLGGPQRALQWGWLRVTVANLVVLGLMLLVLVLAVALPFPRTARVPAPGPPPMAPDTDVDAAGWTGRLRRWAERALPWGKLLPSAQPSYVRSWTYMFGVGNLASLALIVTSGIILAVGGPVWRHRSTVGTFVDDVHLWSVQLFFFFIVLHLIVQALQGSWRGRRRLTWVMGSLAFLVAIASALTGYVSQQNFEAQWIATQAKDGLNAVGAGAFFNVLDTGQVLTVHVVVLPLTVALLVGVHIVLVRLRGVCPPLEDRRPVAVPLEEAAGKEAS
jgi:hypothetical protein